MVLGAAGPKELHGQRGIASGGFQLKGRLSAGREFGDYHSPVDRPMAALRASWRVARCHWRCSANWWRSLGRLTQGASPAAQGAGPRNLGTVL